jgi:hypothetical protein
MKKFLLISFIVCVFVSNIHSQSKVVKFASLLLASSKWDSTKYQKFYRVLIVGAFQQFRNFNNEFTQFMNKDSLGISQNNFAAESRLISGISLHYDKFSFSFATKNQPQNFSNGKGNSKTFNIGFNVGDNRWILDSYYRRFIGFYNQNTRNFDSLLFKSGNYYIQPNLSNSIFMNRLLFFTNHKRFSFKSGFGCNYRQLKSSATWVLGASFNVFRLRNDSSFFPIQNRNYYNDFAQLNHFRSINLGAIIGAAGTLVLFKAWFITGHLTIGPEQQWRLYNLPENNQRISYISFSGTTRISLGLNLKRFYFLISNSLEYSNYDTKSSMNFFSSTNTQNLSLGWRFHIETPKFYEKFMKTKIYGYL